MIEKVCDYVGKLPYMRFDQAQKIAQLIKDNSIRHCLELGFFHGVSTAYIAAALKANGGGHLTTVDRDAARDRSPNVDKILADLALSDHVTVHYEPRSYTWRLMKLIEDRKTFDFCYIDGAHSWDADGFAFFLVEKLLRPGGWLLFDDLDWTYEHMLRPEANPDWLARMPLEEMTTPQIRKVWELLVKPHPSFGNFREDGWWGFAQKVRGPQPLQRCLSSD